MHTTIKFAKTKPNAIIPTKRDEDAGYDIYPCFDEDFMTIDPHETVMIPTGIASACDTDYFFVIKERGSTGTKGMAQKAGIIDSGYRSEWFIPITNTNDKKVIIVKKDVMTHKYNITEDDYIIHLYEKAIAQALLIPVPTTDVEEYTYEEIQAIPSKGE